MQFLLQHGGLRDADSLAFSILALVGMIIPIVVLGVVCWFFWKAKRRDDDEEKRESEWQNAPSS